ncbi:ROK family transcriptional regulator [Numidum massiliense]|uniref:ROK family transcriptional regulator n=1 Tax=Numidum massiliense TaxID=1522315 RepID=UPI0006D54C5A|nr:ROK family transcriptional regulator [Numidum massiliense]
MLEKKAENQSNIRINNQKLILNEIIARGGASRADLAKAIKLSAPSVSANVEPLIAQNILIETRREHATTGRKPIILEFNADYGYVIGMDLSKGRVTTALGNLTGTIVYKKEGAYTGTRVGMDLINFVEQSLHDFLLETKVDLKQVMAVGVASPGILTEREHVRIDPQKLNWGLFPVQDILSRRLKTKVIIENDINMATIGEYGTLSKKEALNSFVFVSVGRGLGAGIIINQQLFKGSSGGAGELAFMRLTSKGDGGEQFAESFVSTEVIKQCLIKKRVLMQPTDDDDRVLRETAKLLQQEDNEMSALIKEMADHMAMIVSHVAAVLNPQKVVIGGELMLLSEYFLPTIIEKVKEVYPFPIEIEVSTLRDEVGLIGSIEIARKEALEQMIQ